MSEKVKCLFTGRMIKHCVNNTEPKGDFEVNFPLTYGNKNYCELCLKGQEISTIKTLNDNVHWLAEYVVAIAEKQGAYPD